MDVTGKDAPDCHYATTEGTSPSIAWLIGSTGDHGGSGCRTRRTDVSDKAQRSMSHLASGHIVYEYRAQTGGEPMTCGDAARSCQPLEQVTCRSCRSIQSFASEFIAALSQL